LERGGIPSLFTSYQQFNNQLNTPQNSSTLFSEAARGKPGKGANLIQFGGAIKACAAGGQTG
jgi:hypothetical protein